MKIARFEIIGRSGKDGRSVMRVDVFGCSWRCPYCGVPELVLPHSPIERDGGERLLEFLRSRRGVVGKVVLTGGEPLEQEGLKGFLAELVALSVEVRMETNGNDPELLRELVSEGLVHEVCMDIKAPYERYGQVVGRRVETGQLRDSIWILKNAEIPTEFSFTPVPGLHTEDELMAIGAILRGCRRIVIREFRGERTLHRDYRGRRAFPRATLARWGKRLERFVESVEVEGQVAERVAVAR